jgi:hypothetical protein
MSKVLTKYSSSIIAHSTHHTVVAIAKVGHRHSETTDNSTRELQICSGSSRVFHKMGRGEASNQHSSNRTEKIFLAEHNMPVQSTQRDNSRQRQAIQLLFIQRLLLPIGVEAAFVFVYHPQSNGEVEKANTLIFTAIKKILENQSKGKWAEDLPTTVWSHNTFICRATKFTPFKVLYGEEPVTPEEIKLRSARTNMEAIHSPSEAESKDLFEPERMMAVEKLQSYQNETKAWREKW